MTHDLIVFAEDWGGLPSSTQHLIRQLATNRKVIWVNSIGLRSPRFSWRDLKRIWQKITAQATIYNQHDQQGVQLHVCQLSNFHLVNPLTIPAPRSQLARWLAVKLLQLQLQPVIKRAQLDNTLLWLSLPTAVDMAGKLGESALLYYCGDDFSALAGVDHETVSLREQALFEQADLVIAASAKLLQKCPPNRSHLLTHGVDYRLFSTPQPRAHDLPNDGRHIAGFYGSLSEWLDLPLLQAIISKLPDWHFVFIGNAVIDLTPLNHFANVHLLGERPHQQLPAYSQHWTVSLLPFRDNAQIQACNPLKLKEYLAAGRPVISTPFPAVHDFAAFVHIANSSADMVNALQRCAHPSQSSCAHAQQASVATDSWTARAAQLSTWLQAL